MNRNIYIDSSDSDNEEEEEMYLDDNNPAFVDFKKNVKIWLELDDDIQTLNEALKARKKKKKK